MYSLPTPLRVENTKIYASPRKYSQKLFWGGAISHKFTEPSKDTILYLAHY